MERIDIHRPSAIIPADYEYVAQQSMKISEIGDCMFMMEENRRRNEHFAKTGGTYSNHEHGGQCAVCGSVNAIYLVIFYHAKTNTYICTGQDCAEKLGMSVSEGEMSLFRRRCVEAHEAVAGKRKAKAILEQSGLSACYDYYIAEWDSIKSNPAIRDIQIIRDIVDKLVQYGSISEKQSAFLGRLLQQIDNAPAIAAQKAQERELAKDCPQGKHLIAGKILSFKQVESMYGITLKMLVQSTDGYKVWGTCPSSLSGAEKGDSVQFMATIEPSKDDKKFGFYSRPSKAEFLNDSPVTVTIE